jgi:type IV secretion system protein VirD4
MEHILYLSTAIIFLLACFGNERQTTTEVGSAKFDPPGKHLSCFNFGIVPFGGLRGITLLESFKNCLVIGQVGAFKTTAVLLSNIFKFLRSGLSMAVLDIAYEITPKTCGEAHRQGYDIYIVDGSVTTDGFNPIELIENASDAYLVADAVVDNGDIGSTTDRYWMSSAKALAGFAITYVRFHTPKEHWNMQQVIGFIELLATDAKAADRRIVSCGDDKLLAAYRVIIAQPEKMLLSTISCTLTALRVFKNEAIARFTSRNTIDFANFRKRKSIIYFCIPLHMLQMYAPISVLMFEHLFKILMSKLPEKDDRSCALLIDELPCLKFKNLGQVWATCRKFRFLCLGVVQSEKLIEMSNTQADYYSLRTNSYTKIYLPPIAHETCKMLQELIGTITEKDERGIVRTRPLMDATALRQSKEAIVLLGGAVLKGKAIPYFKHPLLRWRAKISPYVAPQKLPLEPVNAAV